MSSRLQRMRRVLLAARRLPEAGREAFLQQNLGDDPQLLAELKALLRHDPETGKARPSSKGG